MRLAASSDVIIEELDSTIKILAKWRQAVEAGIPGVDMPGSEDSLDDFLRELCGELLLASSKSQSLSEVLYGGR